MTTPDLLNGLFEVVGSLALWLNVRAVSRDRAVSGFSLAAVLFFTSWGYWNLFYYPHLSQWVSFAGGISVVIANTTYVALILKYRRQKIGR